ncbi:MAG TPA: tetratricopeptide repeat protein [Polyangiaceae bacterium]|jgi:tetratricopeptide (TPR) repeat protein
MPTPHAVVIPFGVPTAGRGLGIGLAALVHACARLDGAGVAIAQLHGRRKEDPADATPSPVEAFVPPSAWPDIAGEARGGVAVVLTGVLEPPGDGDGTLQLLLFDARDGHTRARVDAPLDAEGAGAALVGALERLCSPHGGAIGALHGLRDLAWEPLESVLRAERCALHDPARGGPHDRLAAMLHLGRAIGDAPKSRYPVERLAALALETATASAFDAKLAAAAVRALARAVDDAPAQIELVEALAALELRLGQARQAERRLQAAIAGGGKQPRLFTLLAQTLRLQNDLDGAAAVLEGGLSEWPEDPTLHAERGVVLAAKGDFEGAGAAWRKSLAYDPVQPASFGNLAGLALRDGDSVTAQGLVDAALAAKEAYPDVLRRAVQLAIATEGEGLARASRVAALCARLLDSAPADPWVSLALARSLVVLGDVAGARARLDDILRVAPSTAAGAEAQVMRLTIEHPDVDLDVRSVVRAAHTAELVRLADVAARARRVATLHHVWPGWLAAAVAERRLGRWTAARAALDVALEIAPGATVAHLEMTGVLIALDDPSEALRHAEKAVALEGETPRALGAMARALRAARKDDEALDAATRALALQPQSEEYKALLVDVSMRRRDPSWLERLRVAWRRRPARATRS